MGCAKPLAHATHVVAPVRGCTLPAAHWRHVLERVMEVYVPWPHEKHAVNATTGAYVPAAHGIHVAGVGAYVPGPQIAFATGAFRSNAAMAKKSGII